MNNAEMNQEPQMHVNEFGTKIWTLHGQVHREGAPAIEYANGDVEWRRNGKVHREGAPAIEYTNGTKYWCINGKYHRTNGPAIEYADGTKSWYQRGKLHRTNGAAVEYKDGIKYWYVDGVEYDDVASWAKIALEYQGKTASQQSIDAIITKMMQQDLFEM